MQLYLMVGFSSLTQASFFLIGAGDSVGVGNRLRVIPRSAINRKRLFIKLKF